MKKVLFVATVASFIDGFESNDTKILQDMGYQVEGATSIKLGIKQETLNSLNDKNIKIHPIDFARSPFSKQTFIAYKQLKKVIDNGDYDLIHCHTPMGGILARLAARTARKKGSTVIYTAHGFHFYKSAPLLNWLLYYPAEKICSYFTDVLITINKEDYHIAHHQMKAKKVCYIPGVGIDTNKFKNIIVNKKDKKKSLGLKSDDIMLLSVGELNQNKNHQVIIKALAKLENKQVHYFIAGQGAWKEKLLAIAKDYGVSENVHLLGYRTDIGELCKTSDVFCFPSLREGLGIASLEAMCNELPIITSNVHGINDYSVDGKTGYKCDPKNIDQFAMAIQKLIGSPHDRKQFGEFARESICRYDIKNVDPLMQEIYSEVIV